MGELVFELIIQPLGEIIGYAAGFVLLPGLTLGYIQAESWRARAQKYNWAGARWRDDGVMILSRQATAAWGIILLIGGGFLLAVFFLDLSGALGCPALSLPVSP